MKSCASSKVTMTPTELTSVSFFRSIFVSSSGKRKQNFNRMKLQVRVRQNKAEDFNIQPSS